ncbi:MAG TPA: type II toxin-antitoxin system VapC family toxin [Cyclobacteriaceae bacterium]|nr:type II toxin-antitoxin system VapC family toxin [Cyclobacteriaceae bacterium]HMV07964.1 type II toxin-antitoxin system VapC family toxin [Cyclobacteriaceae bacterium]HMV88232.1 type II toxin-antitoxin system VapC family toxin [Cyclobacteriaceae bacterium]HMW99098.1 type II toxin-antitoxin system VapC family toxin [Cyclobacteriaceae bacterium]HMX48269.1 type II toxin-antitoxin system VapC family toxin [Cyclobacteriaceae bacterium]
MKKYLLDTNICIYFLKGQYSLDKKLDNAGLQNCFISEVTVAELKYGAENSLQVEKNRKVVEEFINAFTIIPIFNALDIYAKEKARLKKKGQLIDDFDLLIGTTAISNDLILITRNVSDFERLEKISIENWVESK